MVEQLNQRVSISKLQLVKRVVAPSQNMLARYLAEDGEATKFRVVRMHMPFGRVSELWHLDMGLGFIGGNFAVVDEDEDAAMQQQQQMEVEENGQAAEAGHGEESAGSVGVMILIKPSSTSTDFSTLISPLSLLLRFVYFCINHLV